ncbi:SIR2-like protein [Dyadobacter jejuensis]|uniref:SIR2-like protein n=1 Tax=Dyadobacter jejuensis TaxID=1082580 RepID=A0A316A4V2_9BACT|nr:SIR2 family protein [Dyadobacter jejuensis]PWJ51834.1 SIR2-like protein [Dyadobacter jejuensis]
MFKEEFLGRLKSFSTAPYLFVGSGLSKRYIDIQKWDDLLESMTAEMKMPRDFNFYLSKANSDLPKVASLLGEEFHQMWWDSDDFKESRNVFSHNTITKYSPLKYEISKYIERKGVECIDSYKEEFELLQKVNIDGIITTNWDTFLQNTFNQFSVFIGQDNLIFNNTISIGEIYKIHGCIKQPNTLIVTEEDYHQYNQRNPYLAAKLLTIFMEHPILFLGYSLSDSNIIEILKLIMFCLTKENIYKLRDRLIFCDYDPSVTHCSMSNTSMMIGDVNIPITIIKYKSLVEIYEVLVENARRLPIKILKHMKEMVYDFVKNTDSTSKIYIDDTFDLEKLDLKKVEFFFGIGTREKLGKVGVKGLKQQDLLDDIIVPNTNFDSLVICRDLLPEINGVFFPCFKYLRDADLLDHDGNLVHDVIPFTDKFIKKINSINQESFYPGSSYDRHAYDFNTKYHTLEELILNENNVQAMIHIPLLDEEKIDLNVLLKFISDNYDSNSKKNPYMKKLICLYDYLKFKKL